MKCMNPQIAQLITRYELNLVSEEERRSFENHLLQCDACFKDFYEMSPVIEVMSENRQELLQAIESTETAHQPAADAQGLVELVKEWLQSQRRPLLAGGAFAFALLVVLILLPSGQSYRDLAVLAPFEASEQTFTLRGEIEEDWQATWQRGRNAYRHGRYAEAIDSLKKAHKLNPEHAGIMLYLGVSYLLDAKPDSARGYLHQVAVDTSARPTKWRATAHWYLGNLFLQANEAGQAKRAFETVVNLDGDHIEEAQSSIMKIQEREDESIIRKKMKYLQHALHRLFAGDSSPI